MCYFSTTSPVECPYDLDENGYVGTIDLLELLVIWRIAGDADFDVNEVIGISDLLIFFAN